jgi:hypothetical protein
MAMARVTDASLATRGSLTAQNRQRSGLPSSRSLPTFLAASLSAAHRLPFSECGARRGSRPKVYGRATYLVEKERTGV